MFRLREALMEFRSVAPSSVPSRFGLSRFGLDHLASSRFVLGIARTSAGLSVATLTLLALLLGWRRLSGGLQQPLEPIALFATGASVVLVAWLSRTIWLYTLTLLPRTNRGNWVVLSISTFALVGIGAALSLRGTPVGGLLGFWGLVVLEECWFWHRTARHNSWLHQPTVAAEVSMSNIEQVPVIEGRITSGPLDSQITHNECRTPVARPGLTTYATVNEPHALKEEAGSHALGPLPPCEWSDEGVLQQMVRRRLDDGNDLLSGWLRAELLPGQRIANLHIPFCPPFRRTPQLEVEQLTGPPGRIKTVQLLPFGARLELKLAQSEDTTSSAVFQFRANSAGE